MKIKKLSKSIVLDKMKRIKWVLTLVVMFIYAQTTHAQVYIGAGGLITDNDTSYFTQQVNAIQTDKLRSQYGLQSIEINLTHPYLQNLIIDLISPDGTRVNIMTNIGGSQDDLTSTVFCDTASLNIQTTTVIAPYTGYFQSNGKLGNINNFQKGSGNWFLVIKDDSPGDVGNLINWKLNFTSNTTGISDTFSSDIPIVYVNSFLHIINADTTIDSKLKIIDHQGTVRNKAKDSVFQFIGNLKIKKRGKQSLNFPQNSFSFELFNDSLNNDTSMSIMNMPPESDWLLINTWNDRSFIRNPLMYHLFRSMGHYATRYQFCEVFLNGEYVGIYQLTEKIKRDKNRVDIAKLKATDLAGDSLTGGYIFQHDYLTDTLGWLSDIAHDSCPNNFGRFQYDYPSYNNIKVEQAIYLRSYVDSFEKMMFSSYYNDSVLGYRSKIDVNSFVDYFICNEFSWNGDGFAKSMFFHKNKDSKDSKLYAGPIWDFDWSLKKMPWVNDSISYWNYVAPPCNNLQASSPWYYILMQDAYFRNKVRCRYDYFRTNILSEFAIDSFIDNTVAIVNEAQQRHYTRWPTWGQSLGTPEQMPYSMNMIQELDTLKAMIKRRLNWIDINLPGICNILSNSDINLSKSLLKIYPNPITSVFNIECDENILKLEILNLLGEIILNLNCNENEKQVNINIENLNPGIYFIRITSRKQTYIQKVVKE